MCGIAGYIGQSKNPELSYEIITNLFKASESRGMDASGFWGINYNDTYYYKNSLKSSEFIKLNEWKSLRNKNLHLLLVHTRQTSVGVGHARDIKNNHPFVNHDKTITMTHNGRIHEYEYLKYFYDLVSECDSEILLRIFEDFDCKLEAIKYIWSVIYRGHMAVAIGEKSGDLWLFRNKHRTLCIIDLIEEIGQVFYVSSPEIWFESVPDCILHKSTLIEMAPNTLIHLNLKDGISKKKYRINCSNNYRSMELNYKHPKKRHEIRNIVDKIKINLDNIISNYDFKDTSEVNKIKENLKDCLKITNSVL